MASDFANDVLAIYKAPNSKLLSPFSVKFENETSVGGGPVREFFSLLMSMIMVFSLRGKTNLLHLCLMAKLTIKSQWQTPCLEALASTNLLVE